MKTLFIHQNFPGQFRHLALTLARRADHSVVSIGREGAPGLPGIRTLRYRPHREVAPQTHPYVRTMESAVLHGQAVFRLLLQLRNEGFTPDVVVAHPGWGETLFVKEVFPQCRLVHFCEYYYRAAGADVGFDPEFPADADAGARIHLRNALHLLNLENCDAAIAPTPWQKSLHPRAYLDKITVAHEGIDTDTLVPDAHATVTLPDGRTLTTGDPVVTFVARNLEPYRGFPTFMRALPAILARHRSCEVVVVGGDEVSYGRLPQGAANWREKMVAEVDIDPSRVHFLGRIPNARYRRVLQVSAVHAYLTYPFVLSWSMLEAMSSGCLLVASDTAPVHDAVDDGQNGYLVDFFRPQALAGRIVDALQTAPGQAALRTQARQTIVSRFGMADGLRTYLDVIAG